MGNLASVAQDRLRMENGVASSCEYERRTHEQDGKASPSRQPRCHGLWRVHDSLPQPGVRPVEGVDVTIRKGS